jgi:exonuclease VII large subunit
MKAEHPVGCPTLVRAGRSHNSANASYDYAGWEIELSTITDLAGGVDIDRLRVAHPAGANIVPARSVALSVGEAVLMADQDATTSSEVSVRGEVMGLHHSAAGHLHFTLCGDRTGLRICAAGLDARLLSPPLPPGTGLADGQVVQVRGLLTCHAERGIVKLRARRVERVRSDVAQAEQALLDRRYLLESLGAEGLLLAQRRLSLPPVPQRIWLVGSEGEDMDEFISVLDGSPWTWDVLYAPTNTNRLESAGAVAAALSAAPVQSDVIVLLQQEGWEGWAVYDSEPVARAVCAARSPVVATGGQAGTRSVADDCAWTALSTATAAAELLCRQTAVSSDRIAEKHRTVLHTAELWVSRTHSDLDARLAEIHQTACEALERCRRSRQEAAAHRARLLIVALVILAAAVAAVLVRGVLR